MELKQDKKNFNRHTKKGLKGISDSIEEVGVIEAITTAKDGTILSGNARAEQMQKAGITKQRVIETDGDEQIVIVRRDIDPYSRKFHRAAYLANKTAIDDINLDLSAIEQTFAEIDNINGTVDSIKRQAVKELYDAILDKYIYEPCEPRKTLEQACDLTEYNKRIALIDESAADDKTKAAARLWATRFIRFDYTEIANNYSVEKNAANKKLYEDLAVVIIGKSEALRQGLLQMVTIDTGVENEEE